MQSRFLIRTAINRNFVREISHARLNAELLETTSFPSFSLKIAQHSERINARSLLTCISRTHHISSSCWTLFREENAGCERKGEMSKSRYLSNLALYASLHTLYNVAIIRTTIIFVIMQKPKLRNLLVFNIKYQ